MNKKFYEAPEMEAIIVNVANTLLAGSGDGSEVEVQDDVPII